MSDHTDRELLERAAKAAGMTMHRYCDAWKAMARYTMSDGYHGPSWNPLTDDGDALRLAVALNMTVRCYMGHAVAQRTVPGEPHAYCEEANHADPCAATRRAIVRAAGGDA